MLAWLVQNTVLAALLAVGVALFCRVSRCRPAVRHVLWLIVLVRLLMPPGLHWPWALPVPLTRHAVPVAATSATEPSNEHTSAVELVPGELIPVAAIDDLKSEPLVESTIATAEPAAARWVPWLIRSAMALWLLGSIVVLIRHVLRLRRLRRWVRLGSAAPGGVAARAAELAGRFHIRSPRVLAVPGLATPLVGCLPRPVLLWPAGLETRLSADGVKAVLAHELAHLRRRDHWVRWLEILAEGVWWWHPLFALIRRKIRQNAELACDAWVVTLLPAARRAYAEALLTVCETACHPAEPAPALGVGGDDGRDFQRRLTMIMREPAAGRMPRRALLCVGLLALLAIPGWTLGQDSPPAEQPPPNNDVIIVADNEAESGDVLILLNLLDSAEEVKAQPAGADRDKKLAELEAKIRAVLAEIQALRREEHRKLAAIQLRTLGEGVARWQADEATVKQRAEAARRLADEKERVLRLDAVEKERVLRLDAVRRLALSQEAQGRTVTRADNNVALIRTTYTLPAAKAKALGAFLKEHLKASVVETTVEDDKLTVTTTPEAQKAIGQLIGLIQGTAGQPLHYYKRLDSSIPANQYWSKPVLAVPANQLWSKPVPAVPAKP